MSLRPGLSAQVRFVVESSDTALKIGSGDVPVLATPHLLAVAERATCAAIADHLEPGTTSVGTSVSLEHRAASPVGALVEIRADLVEVDGRRLVFDVIARDGETVAASGRVERVVVDRGRFLAKLRR